MNTAQFSSDIPLADPSSKVKEIITKGCSTNVISPFTLLLTHTASGSFDPSVIVSAVASNSMNAW